MLLNDNKPLLKQIDRNGYRMLYLDDPLDEGVSYWNTDIDIKFSLDKAISFINGDGFEHLPKKIST